MTSNIKSRQQVESQEVDMNPMLDVVFILLIFFIVTTSFTKENVLDVLRPTPSVALNPSKSVSISINDMNQVFVAGRLTQMDAVSIAIARLSAEFDIKSINLEATKNSRHDTLVGVLNQIKMMGDFPVAIGSKVN